MATSDTNGNPAIWNVALRYGGLCGLAYIVLSLIIYLIDINMMSFGSIALLYLFIFATAIGFSIVGIKHQRDNFEGGYINFGRAFLIALIIAALGSVIYSVWNYVMINFIDTGMVDKMKDQFSNSSWAESIPPDRMEEAMANFDKAGTVETLLKNGLGGGIFIGAIVGLISAAIMRRNRPLL